MSKLGNKLKEVKVYSQCLQRAKVDEKGNIIDYGEVEAILETLGIECPECANGIMSVIKE